MARAQALKSIVLLARRKREICIATADHLIASGLEVIEVASTDETLSHLECRTDIHCVITELDMPGCLSGLDLGRFVTRRWPHIAIIVLGWPTQPTPSLGKAVTFLPKQCSPSSLTEQVHARLTIPSRRT